MWRFYNGTQQVIQQATNNEIYVVLKKQGALYIPDYISSKKPLIRDDQVVIKGKYINNGMNIEYGIEKYFINENTKPLTINDKVEVVLIIGEDLKPRIKNLIVNGIDF